MNKILASAAALVLSSILAASASATLIVSAGGKDIVSPNAANAFSLSTTTVAIAPHPAWQANNPLGRGAVWVSNADTGNGGADSQGAVLTNNADADIILTINETFVTVGNSFLDFSVWADDTARLWLDGVVQKDWNPTNNVCADGPIGCQPNESFNLLASLDAGSHTIRIDAYQTGGGPFGVLYSGEVTVPEPATLTLFGAGLLGLGFLSRRRRKTA